VTMTTGASITIVLSAVALSFATPGVPQGAQLVLAPILVTYGIPPAGIALLVAADTIPDLFATMANVTGDFVAGTVIARIGVVGSATDVAEPVEESASSGDA
jgi:proton glutamate symport protein